MRDRYAALLDRDFLGRELKAFCLNRAGGAYDHAKQNDAIFLADHVIGLPADRLIAMFANG
jgi:hypothetical protein